MNILWGLALSLSLALPAWLLGGLVPLVGAPVFAILIGMLLSAIPRPARFDAGLRWSAKQLLQLSIVLLGFGMNLTEVIGIGRESLAVMLVTMSAAFLTAAIASRALRLSGKLPVLIAVGTAICGGSAIAATAPAIEADDDEIARSISTIFLFNIAAVFLFPALAHLMGLSQKGFGLWAGTAINDTSSVVAAAWSYGPEAGERATVVKLTRTLFIIPIVIFLSWAYAKKRQGATAGAGKKPGILSIFPWFVALFAVASVLGTVGLVPHVAASGLSTAGKFLIAAAMAAIGLRTRFRDLLDGGWRPILLGLLCWAAVAATSLAAQAVGNLW